MSLNVKQRGQAVATFRAIFVDLMETVARWVPTTPEMEVKLLFGAHIWDLAQCADALGKRTHELRLPLQHSMPPAPEYAAFLAELRALADTGQRLAAFHDVALPGLGARLDGYMTETDALMDAPTVRIVERIRADFGRMLADHRSLLQSLPALVVPVPEWSARLLQQERGLRAVAAIADGAA